jgi:flagellar biosynthesis protein FlhF
MNVKRFTGRNSREAMQKVRQAFGDNAVVLSTQPGPTGVEVLAMAPESVAAIERFQTRPADPMFEDEARPAPAEAYQAPQHTAQPAAKPSAKASPLAALRQRAQGLMKPQADPVIAPHVEPVLDDPVQADVRTLAMSTLSFQDYVRERMLKKRESELRAQAAQTSLPDVVEQRLAAREQPPRLPSHHGLHQDPQGNGAGIGLSDLLSQAGSQDGAQAHGPTQSQGADEPPSARRAAPAAQARPPVRAQHQGLPGVPNTAPAAAAAAPQSAPDLGLADTAAADKGTARPARLTPATASKSSDPATSAQAAQDQLEMMRELRAMKGMIEERFGALAFMERLQKSPKQAQLTTRLIECGFSPALIRKLLDSLSEDVGDEIAWAGDVLQRNLSTGETDPALEDQGGVYALVGSTGVGKTTSTAKLAAAFAARHGASNLGLITLDAYRLGAHEQLRAYGRILGVPVHTAHDRVALEDLLDLLSAKKMVLIDTAGLAQRDTRTRELLEMLSHPSVRRLLVLNASSQGETIEDVLVAYKAASAHGIVLSKVDEAVKLGPALDAMIRHRLKVVAVANGQRVPEDWHRLTAQALVHRALRCGSAPAWRMDASEVNLLFTSPRRPTKDDGSPTPAKRSSRGAARSA